MLTLVQLDIFVRVFAYDNNVDVRLEFDKNLFGLHDRERVVWCFEGLLRGLS